MVPLNVERVPVSGLEALPDEIHECEVILSAGVVGSGLSDNGALGSPSGG
jgi:hypothetical protein